MNPGADAPLVLALGAVPRHVDGRVDLDRLAAGLDDADLLESLDDGWSYVVPRDGPRLRDDGRRSRYVDRDGVHDLGPDPFAALDRVADHLGVHPDAGDAEVVGDPDLPPCTGGLVGAFGYDLARRVERLPEVAVDDRGSDHLALRVVDLVVAVAPGGSRALVVGRDLSRRGRLAHRARALVDRVAAIARSPGPRPADPRPRPAPVVTTLPRASYLAAVAAVLERVAAGEVFQANLTQRLTARWPGDVHALYRALRSQSRAPYGAVLVDQGIASISPETFLAVDAGRVVTRPVKGTRPRARDPELDAALADDLAIAAKDRAENVMVVDLLRNDLGRVCRTGSVHVPELTAVEAHPTVWHLVSTVAGELTSGTGYGRLLAATFPCGSVTGAPKIAAMATIERLEPVRRGWYCGAIGFLSPGAARLSVAIRTATLHPDGRVDHGAGGGIVADSDPSDEHAESLDKAAAFLRAVGGTAVVARDHRADGIVDAADRRARA